MYEPEGGDTPFVDNDVANFSSSEDDGAGEPSKGVPDTSKETPLILQMGTKKPWK